MCRQCSVVCLSVCWFVCLSVCLLVCLSVCLFVGLSVCLSVCWFVCVSVSVCLLVTAVSATNWLSRPRCHFECGLWGPNEPCIRWWSRSRPEEGALLGIRRGHAYGCEMWATTRYLCARIDAFDTRDLHRIMSISYTRHIANAEMMAVSAFQQ